MSTQISGTVNSLNSDELVAISNPLHMLPCFLIMARMDPPLTLGFDFINTSQKRGQFLNDHMI